MPDTPIIATKLRIPRLPGVLERDRLSRLLDAIIHKRLALVVAGAGFGKTTLVSRWLRLKDVPAVWYSLDRSDTDFARFMLHLVEGFRNLSDGTVEIPRDLCRVTGTTRRARDTVLFRLIGLLQAHLGKETLLVFDDWHRVHESREIAEAMELMLDRLPFSIHVVIISRRAPNLKVSRLRAAREVIDIGEENLAFTLAETEALYRYCLKSPMDSALTAVLQEKTRGWAAGLILFHCSLSAKEPGQIDARLARLKGSSRYIFQYLEENVFAAQPEEIRRFMLKTSLLSCLDADFCDAFLRIDHSRRLLRQIVEHHLLTFPMDDAGRIYAYHHLLRDFLRAKLAEALSEAEVRTLHLSAARLLEERGFEADALKHFLAGRHLDEAVRLLGKLEFSLLLEGRLRFIRECLDQIPDAAKRQFPRIQYIEAKMCSLAGKPHEAIDWIKAALDNFQRRSDRESVEKCVAELGSYLYYTGDIREAERRLEAALDSGIADPVCYIQVMTFLILFAAILGKIDRSDRHYRSALKRLSEHRGTEKALGTAVINLAYSYRYFVTGDFVKSQEINLEILELAETLTADMLLPLTYFQAAYTGYFLGRFVQGCEWSRAGLALADAKGIQDSQTGWLHLSLGLNSLGLANVDEARVHAKQSLAVFNAHGNRWGMANAHELLHQVHLASGPDLEAAEQSLRRGLDIIGGHALSLTEGILETGLAGVLLEKGRYDPVPALLEKARAKVVCSDYHTLRGRLLHARLHMAYGREETALQCLRFALEMAETHGHERFVAEAGSWIVPLLARLHASGTAVAAVETVFGLAGERFRKRLTRLRKDRSQGIGGAASQILQNLPAPNPPPLAIRLLGKFSVCRGHEAITEDRWKSANTLMLFKYLAARRHRGFIQREELIELLWPEAPYERTRKRFNVAVSTLRKILEPHIRRGAPSAYLIRRDTGLRLDPGTGGWVDAEAFSQEAARAEPLEKTDPESALRHYLKAEALYAGPFLSEDPYVDWCAAERDRLKENFLQVLSGIMVCMDRRGDFDAAIEYAGKYLATDPYAESVYRRMMFFHFMTGNVPAVKKTFAACKLAIVGEMDVPLSTETLDLYRRLVKTD